MTVEVRVQDVANGRVHRRFREDGDRSLYSTCEEPDTSGAFIVLTDAEFEQVDAESLCRVCFEVAL